MIKRLYILLLLSFNVTATDLTIFGEHFTADDYLKGSWQGPMPFSELPSLNEMGVEQYDSLRLLLDTARFDQVLEAVGFKKTGQIKKEIPVVIVMYSEQLLAGGPDITFDINNVSAISVYTLDSKKFGTTTHRLYEPKRSKLKPVNDMTFRMLDLPECSTAYEFGLYWLSDEQAPKNVTALVINNIEVGKQIDSGNKQFGDFRKILKKVKGINNKGIKKSKNSKPSSDKVQQMQLSSVDKNLQSRSFVPQYCGNTSHCPMGNDPCNLVNISCNGGGGSGGWLRISDESEATSIDSTMHSPILYSIKFYLEGSMESSLVIRAYDAWEHVQVNTTTIPMYFELVPILFKKFDSLNAKYSNGSDIVVDFKVKELMQQVINHHRGYGNSNFQSHLDYLQSKVNQYQYQSVNQVSSSLYPGSGDDPLLQ